MPDGFFELIETYLPPEQPVGPQGGRPLIGHRAVKGVLWWVLATGSRWEDVPREMNCSGCTAHRRVLAWEELDIWDRLHASPLKLLGKAGELERETAVVDSVIVRAFGGGEATGPSPVNRRNAGTKHTLMVAANGVPLATRTADANAGDHTQLLPVTLDFPRIGGKPGRQKGTPDEMYADAGHDSEGARSLLLWLGIEPHVAKRGRQHSSGLGKVWWVVKGTIG